MAIFTSESPSALESQLQSVPFIDDGVHPTDRAICSGVLLELLLSSTNGLPLTVLREDELPRRLLPTLCSPMRTIPSLSVQEDQTRPPQRGIHPLISHMMIPIIQTAPSAKRNPSTRILVVCHCFVCTVAIHTYCFPFCQVSSGLARERYLKIRWLFPSPSTNHAPNHRPIRWLIAGNNILRCLVKAQVSTGVLQPLMTRKIAARRFDVPKRNEIRRLFNPCRPDPMKKGFSENKLPWNGTRSRYSCGRCRGLPRRLWCGYSGAPDEEWPEVEGFM